MKTGTKLLIGAGVAAGVVALIVLAVPSGTGVAGAVFQGGKSK